MKILGAMRSAGYDVREKNPFDAAYTFSRLQPAAAPIIGRLQMLWAMMRADVISEFPHSPGLPQDSKACLQFVDEIYRSDAYHLLSIEGYSVTPDLIDKVRQGDWDSDHDEQDKTVAMRWPRVGIGKHSRL